MNYFCEGMQKVLRGNEKESLELGVMLPLCIFACLKVDVSRSA